MSHQKNLYLRIHEKLGEVVERPEHIIPPAAWIGEPEKIFVNDLATYGRSLGPNGH